MKTAIYVEDGTVQLVLTPENEFEKGALAAFQEKPLDAKIFTGSFYDCRGGWVRQADYRPEGDFIMRNQDTQERSLILRAGKAEPIETPLHRKHAGVASES